MLLFSERSSLFRFACIFSSRSCSAFSIVFVCDVVVVLSFSDTSFSDEVIITGDSRMFFIVWFLVMVW